MEPMTAPRPRVESYLGGVLGWTGSSRATLAHSNPRRGRITPSGRRASPERERAILDSAGAALKWATLPTATLGVAVV